MICGHCFECIWKIKSRIILTMSPSFYLQREHESMPIFLFRLSYWAPLGAGCACLSAWSRGGKERKTFHITLLFFTTSLICILRVSTHHHPSPEHRWMPACKRDLPDLLPLGPLVHDRPVTMKTECKNTLEDMSIGLLGSHVMNKHRDDCWQMRKKRGAQSPQSASEAFTVQTHNRVMFDNEWQSNSFTCCLLSYEQRK